MPHGNNRQRGCGSVQKCRCRVATAGSSTVSTRNATMALKVRQNLDNPGSPSQYSTNIIELNSGLDVGRTKRTARGNASPPGPANHPLYPPALRRMLEEHDYQLALVSRGMWNHL